MNFEFLKKNLATNLILLGLFLMIGFLSGRIIISSYHNQHNKQDYSEIFNIKYGLFSINQWKDKLSGIIAEEIDKMKISEGNEKQIKEQVEKQLLVLIDSVDKKIRKSNKGSVKGWVKQAFIDAVVDMDTIKEGVPRYANAVMKEMGKDKNQDKIKGLVKEKIDSYLATTFADQDISRLQNILDRVGTQDVEAAKVIVAGRTQALRTQISHQSWALIIIAALLFLIVGLSRTGLTPFSFIILVLSLFSLLAVGVSTPMIDMEAKISEMSFYLLGHPINFKNQVLYFQSKSVLDVFWIMVTHKDIEMKIVGILMVAFSVVFPVFKILSSLAYYYDYAGARANRWVKFFVLKSGKWSMTDVQIVAIFMAYIGFNGIITSQFGYMKTLNEDFVILTTNGTALQSGFFVFLAYTMLAMFLSDYLTKDVPEMARQKVPLRHLKVQTAQT